jgi:glycerol kinase
MPVVVAIDAGTTGVRAAAFDETAQPVGYRYEEFEQHFPRPGWVEHDANDIWNTVVEVTSDLVAALDEPVAALGITNQRETVVAWDRRTSLPRHRAIVWQDRRTAARCEELAAAGHLPLVRAATGLVLDPYFSGTKMAWLLHEGGVAADDDLAFGTVDSWLLWKLTGGAVHATEPSNASRTMLYDLRTGTWSPELCDLLGVPLAALPEVRPSSGRFGVTTAVAGLPAGVPVSGIAGDQQAALFGQACFEPGMVKNTYGTGSFVLMNVGTVCPEPADGLLTTVAWRLGDEDTYALEGSIFSTGSAVQWLRDGLQIIDAAPEVEALAASCSSSEGVVMVPAFTGMGAPWWDPHARGAILGLTRGSGRAHLARAVLDAMAHQTRDVVEAMSAASGHHISELRADGGASGNELLLQLQADQLQVPIVRPPIAETTALGAAYLAGLAEGVWSSTDAIHEAWRADHTATPAAASAEADEAHALWLRAVERSRHWTV